MKISLSFIVVLFAIGFSYAQDDKVQLANQYYINGDYEKAEDLFEDLSKNRNHLRNIHSNYFNLLISKSDFKKADVYISRALKYYPANIQYKIDRVFLYHKSNETEKKNNYLKKLKNDLSKNQYQLNIAAQNLVNRQLLEEAVYFLKEARKLNGRNTAFALELAAVYRMQNNKTAMTEEYLNYASDNPGNLNYVKNIFQNLLREDEELISLEQTLISRIQKYPDVLMYSELLIWVELQRKNFHGAFIQARAMDKRLGSEGDESMEIGNLAMDNEAWEEAIEIYDYVINEFGDGFNYPRARKMLIRAKEGLVKNRYPIEQEEIRNLTQEYLRLFYELGPNLSTLEALRNKALLHAFYLDEMDSAVEILNYIINTPRIPPNLVSSSKLNLGDIFLLMEQPWEATLLYSQVEKENKNSAIAYTAKLKNAQLSYFTGNFSLAKNHLDILKNATTREISNDAMFLSLLIKNNTVFDTTDLVMKDFASIELLNFQNKKKEALDELSSFIDNNKGHSLTDEAYWLLAEINIEIGEFHHAITYLNMIIDTYSEDILGDDSFFKKAEIYEKYLSDPNQASELYREFLTKYPGSIYVAEARKRFRQLRGDFLN